MVLNPVLGKLVSKRVVLASASPRRQEILTNVVSAGGPLASPRPGKGEKGRRRAGAAKRRAGPVAPAAPRPSRSPGRVAEGGQKPPTGLRQRPGSLRLRAVAAVQAPGSGLRGRGRSELPARLRPRFCPPRAARRLT